jgi:hypothetical protein
MKDPIDSDFLDWLTDRLIHVYGENPGTDFVLRTREMANEARSRELKEKTSEQR